MTAIQRERLWNDGTSGLQAESSRLRNELAAVSARLAQVTSLIERWREDVQAQAALHQERLAEGSTVLWQHFTSTEGAIEHCMGDLERALAMPADPVTRRTS